VSVLVSVAFSAPCADVRCNYSKPLRVKCHGSHTILAIFAVRRFCSESFASPISVRGRILCMDNPLSFSQSPVPETGLVNFRVVLPDAHGGRR